MEKFKALVFERTLWQQKQLEKCLEKEPMHVLDTQQLLAGFNALYKVIEEAGCLDEFAAFAADCLRSKCGTFERNNTIGNSEAARDHFDCILEDIDEIQG